MTAEEPQERWIARYDQVNGWAHLLRAQSTDGHHWQEHRLDEAVSDPNGNFLVYVDQEKGEDLLISLRYTEAGPIARHEDFNELSLGSPTLFPAHLMRTIWWTEQPPWPNGRPLLWVPVPDERVIW